MNFVPPAIAPGRGRRSSWTEEQVVILREMWAAGNSAAIVAERFGITRSMVIGKVHRLGLPERETKFSVVREGAVRLAPDPFLKPRCGFRVHVAGHKAQAIIKQAKLRKVPLRIFVRELLDAIAHHDLFEAVIGEKYPASPVRNAGEGA